MEENMSQVKWELGEVLWFDEYGGEGQIRAKDGKTLSFHYTAIESKKKWKSIKSDKKIKFKASDDPSRPHAAKVKEI